MGNVGMIRNFLWLGLFVTEAQISSEELASSWCILEAVEIMTLKL